MIKLFLALSSLFSLTAVVPLVTTNSAAQQSQKTSTFAVPKETYINASSVSGKADDLVLRTEPINLTALGIHGNNALNQYEAIELVSFQVNFGKGSKIVNDGWKWGAKMSEGEGNWVRISEFITNYKGYEFKTRISRKYSLWYDANGNYNLALIYLFNCFTTVGIPGAGFAYAPATATTGSLVKFY